MKRIFLVILALLLLGAAELFRSNAIVGVTHYQLALSELPEAFSGFRIVQLSDLHNREFSGLEEKIARERPDLVVMTGDMVSASDRDFSAFLTLAQRVAAQFPTYYIVGNHEQALPRAALAELTARLADAGVVILDNRAVQITRGGAHINLYGLWFNLRFYRDKNDARTADYIFGVREMEKILGSAPRGECNLLLTHNPVYFDAYAQWGAVLTLCGHMHGGMVRIPGYGGLLSPEKEYFPQYDAGLFTQGDAQMLVSRGLGESAGLRFLNPPELIVIDLTKKGT